jgi:hypothetical protein
MRLTRPGHLPGQRHGEAGLAATLAGPRTRRRVFEGLFLQVQSCELSHAGILTPLAIQRERRLPTPLSEMPAGVQSRRPKKYDEALRSANVRPPFAKNRASLRHARPRNTLPRTIPLR